MIPLGVDGNPRATKADPKRRWGIPVLVLPLALAVIVRILVWSQSPLSLYNCSTCDPDDYRRFAGSLRTASVYGPSPEQPSAYRPPAYPLLIALLSADLPANALRLLAFQLLLNLGTVAFVFEISRRAGSPTDWAPAVAATVVAGDPLLAQQSGLAMTEALFTFLTAGVIFLWNFPGENGRRRLATTVALGGAVAVGALTRPILWPVWATFGAILLLRRRCHELVRWGAVLGLALAVSTPWVLRNQCLFGRPILTTTHGGYTLWLGMNPAYYAEVVAGSRSVWTESFADWTWDNVRNTSHLSEIERDDYFRRQAIDWMRHDVGRTLKTMVWHVLSLWWPAPRLAGALTGWACVAFFVPLFSLAFLGLIRTWRDGMTPIMLAFFLTFTAVHSFYWSDVRMRCPLVVPLALLAGSAITGLFRTPDTTSASLSVKP